VSEEPVIPPKTPRWQKVFTSSLVVCLLLGLARSFWRPHARLFFLAQALPLALLLVVILDLAFRVWDRSQRGGGRPRPEETLNYGCWILILFILFSTGLVFLFLPYYFPSILEAR
jgi:hypothetical protein